MPLAHATNEPIPGYQVQKRIGAGGYGEVWTVEAPGGLAKAIKFVYGYLDEERASREMKALGLIKSVRHPFLISLERIEVVEGQLLIITELAEGSLKDRFDQCQKEGLPGIPRDELLTYIRDAADALDYMSENHSLQHLDIKPENLLVVGRHVKVADFGLVKELHEVTGSLMGGLTPLYAPPESFDGRPSRHSDQYSLAIVYQEMLTGVLPFPGTTAAQLAAQHMHSKPRVSTLPSAEQQVILKALAKDPADRYLSCSEMVEQLQLAARGGAELPQIHAEQLSSADRASVSATSHLAHISRLVQEIDAERQATEVVANKQASAAARRKPAQPVRESGWSIPPVNEAPELETAPPIQVDESLFSLRPTLFVGIGGTAGHILANLSQRLHDRFSGKTIPIFRSLLLETDGGSAMQLAHACAGDFDSQQAVIMPLRRPQDYRNSSRSLLQTISRRWIYNVPRSQQTAGIRPLGRLAFLDHADKVARRLREEIASLVRGDTIAAAEKLVTAPVDPAALRIYVVASVSGGTGGGMLMDVAYAVKQTLANLNLPDRDIHALLCHSTPRSQAAKDLAIANSYACLSELQHFSRADRPFPGDGPSGLEPLAEGQKVFRDISLLHLGEEVGQRDFDAGTQQAAEYLYLDTVTPCALLFDERHADQLAAERPAWDIRVKTFGLMQLGGALEGTVNDVTRQICCEVIQRWRGEHGKGKHRIFKVDTVRASDPASETDGSSMQNEATQLAAERVAEMQLSADTFFALSQTALGSVFGADLPTCFQQLREQVAEDVRGEPSLQNMIEATESLFGPRAAEWNQADELEESLRLKMQRHLSDHAGEIGPDLSAWILRLLDRPTSRLKGAQQAAEWIKTYLRGIQDKYSEYEQQTLRELSAIPLAAPTEESKDKTKARSRNAKGAEATDLQLNPAWKYFQLRWMRIATNQARRLAQSICVYVAGAADQLRDLGREFGNLERHFTSSESDARDTSAAHPHDDVSQICQQFRERLLSKFSTLMTELDHSLCSDYFAPLGGMQSLVTADNEVRSATPAALYAAARRIVRKAQQQIDVSELLLPNGAAAEQAGDMLQRFLKSAKPRLADCGGRSWLTVALPRQADQQRVVQQVAEHCQQEPSVVGDTDSDVVLLNTIDNIRLSQIAARLIDGRPDYAEAASRLYTRCDINWTPWDDVQA